jgi:hypothetical protein
MVRLLCSLRFLIAVLGVLGGAAGPGAQAQEDAASRRAAIEAMYPVMMRELEARNFGRARNICDQAIIWEPQNPVHHYNLACIEAQAGGPRLAQAMGELELAIALGFNDPVHLQGDPDLLPLHGDPKFGALVRKVITNATSVLADPARPAPAAGPSAPATSIPDDRPAAAAFRHGVPVGLYYLTRYWPETHVVENAAWYFAPDGTVYQNLEHGFSRADLQEHAGRKGQASADGKKLLITWGDQATTESELERDGAGFVWDRGIFSPIAAFTDRGEVAGVYEGSAPATGPRASGAAFPQRLELQRDGSFRWTGCPFTRPTDAANPPVEQGQWELRGFSLLLTTARGTLVRGLAFPDDDEKTPVDPDRMYFAGTLYKRMP